MLYFVSKDSPDSRKRLPIAVILAFITNCLIVIWVIVYIYLIYPHGDEVYVGSGERADDGEEETRYQKESKPYYIFWQVIISLLNLPFYADSYFVVRNWVRANDGYQNSN